MIFFLFIGPPGAGKGTVARLLMKIFKRIFYLSSGDLLRENIKNSTPLGKQAESHMKKAELVPDELVIAMIEDAVVRLLGTNTKIDAVILDGFPRTPKQADALLDAYVNATFKCVYFDVPDEVLVQRVVDHWYCPNCQATYSYQLHPSVVTSGCCPSCQVEIIRRFDDTEEKIIARLQEFHRITAPLIASFETNPRICFKKLDGEEGPHALALMAGAHLFPRIEPINETEIPSNGAILQELQYANV